MFEQYVARRTDRDDSVPEPKRKFVYQIVVEAEDEDTANGIMDDIVSDKYDDGEVSYLDITARPTEL